MSEKEKQVARRDAFICQTFSDYMAAGSKLTAAYEATALRSARMNYDVTTSKGVRDVLKRHGIINQNGNNTATD